MLKRSLKFVTIPALAMLLLSACGSNPTLSSDLNFFADDELHFYADNADPNPEKDVTLLWFSATWCHVCAQMRPFVGPTSLVYPNLEIKEIDIDQHPKIAAEFKILGTPTFIPLDSSGKQLFRFSDESQTGFEAQLQRALEIINK